MPSGPKKRKAAKKKKESRTSADAHSHVDDDVENPESEEVHNNGGYASSPTSQDHHNDEDHLTENEKEENGEGDKLSEPLHVETEIRSEDKPNEANGRCESNETVSMNDSETQSHGIKGSLTEDKSNEENGRSEHEEVVKGSQDEHKISPVDSIEQAEEVHAVAIEELRDSAIEDTNEFSQSQAPVTEHAIGEMAEKRSSIHGEGDDFYLLKAATTPPKDIIIAQKHVEAITSGDNVAEHDNGLGVNEPFLTTAPRPEQTTFWNGCCGLFEVFKGSAR